MLSADQVTLVLYGSASGNIPPFLLVRLAGKNVKGDLDVFVHIHYYARGVFEELYAETAELVEKGQLKIAVHKVYPIEDVQQAHLDLEGRKTTGKLLLKSPISAPLSPCLFLNQICKYNKAMNYSYSLLLRALLWCNMAVKACQKGIKMRSMNVTTTSVRLPTRDRRKQRHQNLISLPYKKNRWHKNK